MSENRGTHPNPEPAFNGLTPSRLNDPARVGREDECANCGASYVVKTKDQKCCCDRCRIEYWHAVKGKLPQRLAALERRVLALESSR